MTKFFETEEEKRELSSLRAEPASPPSAGGDLSSSALTSVSYRIVEYLSLVWEERRFLARATAAGLAAGILLAFLLPSRYQSTVQLMPPDSQSSSGMAMLAALTAKTGNGLGAIAGDVLGLKSSGALFVGILRSRTIQDRLVQGFDLKKVYGVRLEEDARKELGDNTWISEDHKSGIISVAVSDRDPRRAASLAQAYIQELDRLVAQLSTSAAHRERVFLEERLGTVKQDLDQASQDFSQFASKNTAIDIKEQGKAMVEAVATLQGQLIAAESELKGLEAIYTPNNVRVRSVQARIAELREQLAKMGGNGPEGPTQRAQLGERADRAKRGEMFYPSIRELPLLGVTYADLYRRTKIQEVVYETLTQQYELAKVQEARETPSVKVLDSPEVPERKSSPKRVEVALLCSFVALVGGVVLVLARVGWNGIEADDQRKVFVQSVFRTVNATMPWAPPNGSRLQLMTHKVWIYLKRRNESDRGSNAA